MEISRALRLLELLPTNVAIELPDGTRLGAADAASAVTIAFGNEESATKLSETPSLLGFAEAFVSEQIDVRGDLLTALEAAYSLDASTGLQASATAADAQGSTPELLEVKTPRAAPSASSSDAEAIRHHYDVSNDFFALFLDRRMVYTCAYYRNPAATLDEAQEAKLELICRKLRLAPGERFLDVGCGWGALTAWAVENHDVDSLGVTLSRAQADFAQTMVTNAGFADRARVAHRDYRDIEGEASFHKIAAIGMIEHVGVARYPEYFSRLFHLLRPGGLLLNHGITHATPGRHSSGMAFLTRHVFPGAEFERVSHVLACMEEAGFEILDVEALGGHYACTTAAWLSRLQANADVARSIVGERVYRTWIGYLAAATVAFRAGWIDLHQVLARRPDPLESRRPETRERIYLAPWSKHSGCAKSLRG